MKKVTVYILKDPITDSVMYVGSTTFPLQKRLQEHLTDKVNKGKRSWIGALKDVNMKPKISALETIAYKDSEKRERHWIKLFRDIGEPVLNIQLVKESINKMENAPLTSIRLDAKLKKKLKQLAKIKGTSLHALIVDYLKTLVN